jgi:NAD-dependent SIR2 family protein deacetylase
MRSRLQFLAEDGSPRRQDGLPSVVSLLSGRRFVVLTGAGCSTDSGIPDYRGPSGSLRRRAPIQYQDFLHSAATRQRYWARSTLGFPQVLQAQPNAVHRGLARLEQAGLVTGLITQNVDGLHSRAGSQRVVELHGSLHSVRCLGCGQQGSRQALQADLLAKNPNHSERSAGSAPDGDADFEPDAAPASPFVVPACDRCGGMLKPDVVFFGENVPRSVVDAAWALFAEASALLVLGSSLAVYSGFRFARGAAERGLPIVVINQGPTRADDLAALRLEAPLSPTMIELCQGLGLPDGSP